MPVLTIMKSSRGKGKRPRELTEEEQSNLTEFKRINKTLTLETMIFNEPYTRIPYQYRPAALFEHEPPQLSFGFKFTDQELADYAASKNIIPSSACSLSMAVSVYVTELVGSIIRDEMCTSGKTGSEGTVLTIYTNYGPNIPREEVDRIIAWFKTEFKFDQEPRWYITELLERLDEKETFRIPVDRTSNLETREALSHVSYHVEIIDDRWQESQSRTQHS
ncbi:hypothetical protein BDN72DRAFT_964232 [Pluteus cervinus]|uniref:Uncharacterized protein n=1 Tax=Pluteus cervinus TaxID=181527 RepID=A0ACD3ABI9_9AGAR|nr:hypothetical protein BDN72DRAFT_964232 [Pluteus cervinus]